MKRTMMAIGLCVALATGTAWAADAAASRWIDSEFQPSTLTKAQQANEMAWFAAAGAKLRQRGVKEISVVSETLTTHEYESKTLARAFEEITGIKVKHDLVQEGDLVEKLQTSLQSGRSIYDGWVSDSDLIGTHYRYGMTVPLTDHMSGAGKEYTNKGLREAVLGVMPVQHHLKPDAAALGNWLRSHKERRVGKLRFRKQDATGSTATLWWVEEG